MDIISVIESYGIELVEKGSVHIGFCPFHDDKNTPNLTVYPKTNSFYCYACKTGGDIIQFIALIEQSDRETVRKRFAIESIKSRLKQLKNPTEVNFKPETNLLVANLCRDHLQRHRDDLSRVLEILKKFDRKLSSLQEITYQDGMRLVEKFRNYLVYIREGYNGTTKRS